MTDETRPWDAFALLLIDVQQDFWADGMSQSCADYESNVRRLLELCRRESIDIVHIRARFQKDRSDWMARYLLTDNIPCIEDTAGVEVLPCADAEAGEFVIYKQSFDAFRKLALDAWLQKNEKDFVLVAGLVTSVCVLLTAASAAQRGYLVGLVEDCCADETTAHEHTLERYPFIFERTSVSEIVTSRERWLAELDKTGV